MIGGKGLSGICRALAVNYKKFSSGAPDLLLIRVSRPIVTAGKKMEKNQNIQCDDSILEKIESKGKPECFDIAGILGENWNVLGGIDEQQMKNDNDNIKKYGNDNNGDDTNKINKKISNNEINVDEDGYDYNGDDDISINYPIRSNQFDESNKNNDNDDNSDKNEIKNNGHINLKNSKGTDASTATGEEKKVKEEGQKEKEEKEKEEEKKRVTGNNKGTGRYNRWRRNSKKDSDDDLYNLQETKKEQIVRLEKTEKEEKKEKKNVKKNMFLKVDGNVKNVLSIAKVIVHEINNSDDEAEEKEVEEKEGVEEDGKEGMKVGQNSLLENRVTPSPQSLSQNILPEEPEQNFDGNYDNDNDCNDNDNDNDSNNNDDSNGNNNNNNNDSNNNNNSSKNNENDNNDSNNNDSNNNNNYYNNHNNGNNNNDNNNNDNNDSNSNNNDSNNNINDSNNNDSNNNDNNSNNNSNNSNDNETSITTSKKNDNIIDSDINTPNTTQETHLVPKSIFICTQPDLILPTYGQSKINNDDDGIQSLYNDKNIELSSIGYDSKITKEDGNKRKITDSNSNSNSMNKVEMKILIGSVSNQEMLLTNEKEIVYQRVIDNDIVGIDMKTKKFVPPNSNDDENIDNRNNHDNGHDNDYNNDNSYHNHNNNYDDINDDSDNNNDSNNCSNWYNGWRYECMFVEVKGPTDHLADHQLMWLRMFDRYGVMAIVGNVRETEEKDEIK